MCLRTGQSPNATQQSRRNSEEEKFSKLENLRVGGEGRAPSRPGGRGVPAANLAKTMGFGPDGAGPSRERGVNLRHTPKRWSS